MCELHFHRWDVWYCTNGLKLSNNALMCWSCWQTQFKKKMLLLVFPSKPAEFVKLRAVTFDGEGGLKLSNCTILNHFIILFTCLNRIMRWWCNCGLVLTLFRHQRMCCVTSEWRGSGRQTPGARLASDGGGGRETARLGSRSEETLF